MPGDINIYSDGIVEGPGTIATGSLPEDRTTPGCSSCAANAAVASVSDAFYKLVVVERDMAWARIQDLERELAEMRKLHTRQFYHQEDAHA